MEKIIKYIQGPTFSKVQWESVNPTLLAGEIGYELGDDGKVKKAKVGPGAWNDIAYLGEDFYTFTDAVTNPIGAITSTPTGMSLAEIVKGMISPYLPSTITSLVNNAAGAPAANITQREIGQILNSNVQFDYVVSSPGNLAGALPIEIIGGAYFPSSFIANTSSFLLAPSGPINPTSPLTVTLGIRALHQQGLSPTFNTQIKFSPKIMWFSSPLSEISDSITFMAQGSRQNVVSDVYKRNYSFPGNGYSWVAIPAMLSPGSYIFTDLTDPNRPAGYGMEVKSSFIINNGTTSYLYTLLRSTFYLNNATVLKIS